MQREKDASTFPSELRKTHRCFDLQWDPQKSLCAHPIIAGLSVPGLTDDDDTRVTRCGIESKESFLLSGELRVDVGDF